MAVDEKILSIIIRAKNMTAGGLKGAEDGMGRISKGTAAVGAGLTAFGAAGAAAYNKAANTALDYGKEVITIQRLTGATAKDSSIFAAVLGRVGVTGKATGTMMKTLSKQIFDDEDITKKHTRTIVDADGKRRKIIETITKNNSVLVQNGIATRDATGQHRSAVAVTRDLAEWYSKQTDKSKANVVAAKALGKNFMSLLPILSGGAKAFDSVAKKAAEMGLVLSGKNIDDIKAYAGAVKDNEMAQKGLEVQMGLTVLPIKTMIQEGIMKAFAWFNKLSPATKFLVSRLGLLAVGAALIVGPLLVLVGMLPVMATGFGIVGTSAAAAWVAVTGPIGLIIAAIALVAGGIYLIVRNWKDIKKFFTNAFKGAKEAVINGYHAVVDWLKKNALNLATALIPGLLLVRLLFAVNWKKVGESVKDGLSAAGRWIVEWVGKIGGWFISLPGKLQDIAMGLGKSIATGIWDGLKAMATWLYNQVWSWIKSVIPGPIKVALGISSPSALMHQYGRMVALGMGGGVIAGTDGVRKAAVGLASAVTAGARLAIQPPSYSFGSASFAGGGPIRSTMPIGAGTGPQKIAIYLDGKELTRATVKQVTQSRRSGAR